MKLTSNMCSEITLHLLASSHLTHWGRVTHICARNLTIIGPDNGLSPGRRQAIIWTTAGVLLIGPWGTNFCEILIDIQTFSFKKMHLRMASAKWHSFCLSLNVLKIFFIRDLTVSCSDTYQIWRWYSTGNSVFIILKNSEMSGMIKMCSVPPTPGSTVRDSALKHWGWDKMASFYR